MGLYFHRYPKFFDWMYPNRLWRKKEKAIYLTFDDGPIPEITPWIVTVLNKYDIRATFFCVGENIIKYPSIKDELIASGHQLANHTFNHDHARNTDWNRYWESILKCEKQLGDHSKKLFRPPHGRLPKTYANKIMGQFKIVMWTVLSGDFDTNITKEKVLNRTIESTTSGSIVVFHDNIKCQEKMKWVLPRYIEAMLLEGYKFETL